MKTSLKLLCSTVAILASVSMFASTGHAGIKNVKCSSGQSLQTAINNASAGDEINVNGECKEGPIFIDKNLTVLGPAKISPADDANENSSVVFAQNANVTLVNLDVDAKNQVSTGILLEGATARIWSVDVYDALGNGLQVVGNSWATMDNSSFNDSGNGIAVSFSSSIFLRESKILDNDGFGLTVFHSSSAFLTSSKSNNLIDGNGKSGVVSSRNSSVQMNATTVTSNKVGVDILFDGFVDFLENPVNTIQSNTDIDVRCVSRGGYASASAQISATAVTDIDNSGDFDACLEEGVLF